ncbi:hypothetical protein H8E06_00785 [bacterium]|nr:hypothetical protein [bacterium]
MSKFDDIISSYCGGLLNEQDPAALPAEEPAVAAPIQPDATLPQADTAPMTHEGRIQMLDMVRKALLVSPADLKDSEKMELGTAATHENVETKKHIIERIFSRLDATGTTDLNAEEPGEEY